jgi:hypothetical protein
MMPQLHRKDEIPGLTPAAMHELACEYAEEMFARRGACPFMWIILSGDHWAWIETPWEDDREKRLHTYLIAELLQEFDAHAYTFISEAWVAVSPPGPDGKMPENVVPPSERPKNERDDVLFVLTQERDKPSVMSRYLVTMRPPGLGLNYLGPRQDEGHNMDGGMLVDLFHKRFKK